MEGTDNTPKPTGFEDASDEEVAAGCLAWCNEKRAEQGLETLDKLPKGRPADPKSCPCGSATGLQVFSVAYAKPDQKFGSYQELLGNGQVNPPVVREFILRFDNGGLSKYRLENR